MGSNLDPHLKRPGQMSVAGADFREYPQFWGPFKICWLQFASKCVFMQRENEDTTVYAANNTR